MRTSAYISPSEPAEDYLTVAEAARLVKVSPSTIWRWIDHGTLTAYRVGSKAVRIKKADIEACLTPLRAQTEIGSTIPNGEQIAIEPLTRQQQQQGLRALARMQHLRGEITAKYGPHSPASWDLLNESRSERTAELTRDQSR